MRLIHHDKAIVTFDRDRLYQQTDRDYYFKPHGLWVSDEDDFGWSHWCTSESFAEEHLVYEHLVELVGNHNVLFIRNVDELDAFHRRFSVDIIKMRMPGMRTRKDWLDWTKVYPLWQGIIVSPYLWERRMDYMWYYGWDCASGCIWDLSAIARFTPLLKQLTWKGGT